MFEARKSRAAVFAVAATLALPVLGLASPVRAVGATPAPIANLRATLHDPGSGGNSDYFGVSVATSAAHAFVAAPGTNGFAGAVYVYTKRSGAWPATPTVTLHDPAASTGDLF